MSKFSKFLVFSIVFIITIVSLVVPTYCFTSVPPELYEISNYQNISSFQNFYNAENLKDVYYSDFTVSFTRGYGGYVKSTNFYNYCKSQSGNSNVYNIPYNSYIYFYGLPLFKISGNLQTELVDGDTVYFSFNYYLNNVDDDYRLYPSKLINTGGLSFDLFPSEFYNNCSNVTEIDFTVNPFYFGFKINLGNQYYYVDNFGLIKNLKLFYSQGLINSLGPASNVTLFDNFYDNSDYSYSKTTGYSFAGMVHNQNSWFKVLKNNFNYENSYVSSINTGISSACNYKTTSPFNLSNQSIQYNCFLNYYDDNEFNIFLFATNSLSTNSMNSSIIANGSNEFYKSAEWWDVPAHLYNFFIYLVFDAPIISNFTKLVMVIINFIVEVFEFFIGLFQGINNIFFISIFLGIIVLIFLLKIIFKG